MCIRDRSNPLLNIGIMQSEADLAYQENEVRNTRIRMEQERLSLKQDRIGMQKDFLIKKRRYGQYKRLMEEQYSAADYSDAKSHPLSLPLLLPHEGVPPPFRLL